MSCESEEEEEQGGGRCRDELRTPLDGDASSTHTSRGRGVSGEEVRGWGGGGEKVRV